MAITESNARTARQTNERRKPVFVVRAPDPNARGRWVTLGHAGLCVAPKEWGRWLQLEAEFDPGRQLGRCAGLAATALK